MTEMPHQREQNCVSINDRHPSPTLAKLCFHQDLLYAKKKNLGFLIWIVQNHNFQGRGWPTPFNSVQLRWAITPGHAKCKIARFAYFRVFQTIVGDFTTCFTFFAFNTFSTADIL